MENPAVLSRLLCISRGGFTWAPGPRHLNAPPTFLGLRGLGFGSRAGLGVTEVSAAGCCSKRVAHLSASTQGCELPAVQCQMNRLVLRQ